MAPRSRDAASESGASSSVARPTRHRTANACDQCRRKRQRCDLDRPACGLCSYRNETCTYDQGYRGGAVPKQKTARPPPESKIAVPKSPRATKVAAVAELRELTDLLNPDTPSSGVDMSDDDSRRCLAFWMQPEASAEAAGPLIQEVAQSWPVYSRVIADHSASEQWARTQPAHVLYLPSAEQADSLLRVFFQYNNFFFELADPAEFDSLLGILNTSRQAGFIPDTALKLAIALARCRTALATISNEKAESLSLGKRAALLELWNISCIGLLKASRFTECPTLEGLQVLITLLGTLFFEHQFGLTGGSPATRGLRRLAVKAAYALGLHIDPTNHDPDSDYKRRLWWSIATLDAHFAATGSTPHEIIDLAIADTKIPRSPTWSSFRQPGLTIQADSLLDLRSSESRFIFCQLNNQITRLIIRQVPLPTAEDVHRMDEVITSWMSRVMPGQSPTTFIDTTDLSSWSQDPELARSQRIAFIAFWHLRARLHRPIVKTEKPTVSPFVRSIRPPLHSSTSVVIRCSYLLLDMHRLGEMSAAFKAAIAQAAISLLIIAYDWGGMMEEVMARVGPFIRHIETTTSPTLQRARSLILGLKDVVTQKWEVSSPFSAPFASPGLCQSPTLTSPNSGFGVSQSAASVLGSNPNQTGLEPLFSSLMTNVTQPNALATVGIGATPTGMEGSEAGVSASVPGSVNPALTQTLPTGLVGCGPEAFVAATPSGSLMTSRSPGSLMMSTTPGTTLSSQSNQDSLMSTTTTNNTSISSTTTTDSTTLGFFGPNMEWTWPLSTSPTTEVGKFNLGGHMNDMTTATTGATGAAEGIRSESMESTAKLDHLKMLLGDEEVDPYLPSSWPSYSSSPLSVPDVILSSQHP